MTSRDLIRPRNVATSFYDMHRPAITTQIWRTGRKQLWTLLHQNPMLLVDDLEYLTAAQVGNAR